MFKLFASPSALLLLACSEATATGKIAVIGGANGCYDHPGQGHLKSMEIIAQSDSVADTEALWVEQTQTPLQADRKEVAAVSIDGTLYAIGGIRVDNTAVKKCEMLDTTNSGAVWENCPDLQERRTGHAAAAHAGKVYAIGGYIQGSGNSESYAVCNNILDIDKTLEILDTTANPKAWVYGPELTFVRSWMAAVAVRGKLYAIGGRNHLKRNCNPAVSGTVEVLDLSGTTVGPWVYLENAGTQVTLNTPRFGHAASEYNGKIYVTGGVANNGFAEFMEFLDTANPMWTNGPRLVMQRQLHASAFIGGKLSVMGGTQQTAFWGPNCVDPNTNNVEMLDIANIDNAQWVTSKPLANSRHGHAAVAYNAVVDADCKLGAAVLAADCTVDCGTLTQAITTAATGSGTCNPETYACNPGNGACAAAFSPTCGEMASGGSAFAECGTDRVYDSDKASTTNPSDDICCKASVDATEESVTAAAEALAGTDVAGFAVVAGSVTVTSVGDDLIVRLTVEGELADFNEVAVKEALATKLGVPKKDITLNVKAGSIVVTATVHNPDAGVADPIVSPIVEDANSQVSDASHANLALVFVMVVMTSLQLVCY